MSTSSLSVNSTSTSGSPITVTGLASGLDTSSIISALMNIEREPVTHLTNEQARLQAEQTALQSIQTSLQQVSFAAAEFTLPSLYESSQTVTSNEPQRVSALATAGAAIGGYEVEVLKLANAAQRTFTFTSPESESTLTIEGQEFTLKAGESAKELADAINANTHDGVYAAALESGEIVLSSRTTGATGAEFIKVSAGGALSEKEGTAKEGQDAEYKVDGVLGTSASNTLTEAIPGVTLTLGGLTPSGPVTIDVQAPGLNSSAIEKQVQAFIKSYNSTVEAIQKQLATKRPDKPTTAAEFATGTLFGDSELTGLLDSMRVSMYEPIAGLETSMSSLADIGVSTGAALGSGSSSQASLEGLLTLEPAKLSEAVQANPTGVEKMLRGWSENLQTLINNAAEPGGAIESRAVGDEAQISQLTTRINNMNEMLASREKALQETYAELEGVISKNSAQDTWLTEQTEALTKSGS